VEIPPGVVSGSRFRVPGKGHIDLGTGKRGDLYVVTNVAPHHFFRRVEDNLYCTVPITVPEAALGGKVPVPTIDGATMLRVPPGVQPGQTLRLRGKGAPSLRAPGARGDQYVEVKVVVPRVADERSREILRELARLNPESPRKDWGQEWPAHGR
jgi:DnaJ-class molecular chaperone